MEKLRIVLLGKQGAGKSASGNTPLGVRPFHTAASSKRVTQTCSMSFATVDGQTIEVIDTPGWSDSSQFETEIKPNIINYINACKPHVFLLVLPIGRFTNKEINTVVNILKEFGDEVNKYMIVLFTKGDELEDRPIEDYLEDVHSDLKKVIQVCGERYHVFNNREKKDHQQISSLLKKINDLVEKNEEKCYTKAMYEKKELRQTLEANNSVPEKIKSSAEDEKTHDDQGSSCEADGKEKEKGETSVDRKELENLKQKIDELTKTVQNLKQNIDELTKTVQKTEQNIDELTKTVQSSAEDEKTHDDQGSSCEADGKEKEKGETSVDRKELENLKQKIDELTKTVQKTEQNIDELKRSKKLSRSERWARGRITYRNWKKSWKR